MNPNLSVLILIYICNFEFQGRINIFSNEIVFSIFPLEFLCPNPNFSHKISDTLLQSEYQCSNPNFSDENTVSISESEIQFAKPYFRQRIRSLNISITISVCPLNISIGILVFNCYL